MDNVQSCPSNEKMEFVIYVNTFSVTCTCHCAAWVTTDSWVILSDHCCITELLVQTGVKPTQALYPLRCVSTQL